MNVQDLAYMYAGIVYVSLYEYMYLIMYVVGTICVACLCTLYVCMYVCMYVSCERNGRSYSHHHHHQQHQVKDAGPGDVMDLLLLTQYFDMLKDVGTKNKTGSTLFLPHGPHSIQVSHIYVTIRAYVCMYSMYVHVCMRSV